MLTKIQKWGNSLAVRIPKAFAHDVNLEKDSVVEISLVEGQIVIKPNPKPDWSLDELLTSVNKNNIHREIETGYPAGNEIW